MKNTTILLAALLLSACTQYWVKPGSDTKTTAKDLHECRTEGAKTNQGGQIIFTAEQIEGPCMTAKGYSLSYEPAVK